jgi:hypothetical protein
MQYKQPAYDYNQEDYNVLKKDYCGIGLIRPELPGFAGIGYNRFVIIHMRRPNLALI